MSTRKLPDWLKAYAEYTKDTEPPASYHVWTGISVIAGALERKVYLDWGHERIYPNMYIILVGPSGRARKGTAMAIGRRLLRDMGEVKLLADNNTPESIIVDIKTSTRTFTDNEGKFRMQSAVTCISPEFAVFAGQQNSVLLAYLTDWYDSADKWERRTKNQGRDEIIGMCFNLLAAIAPDWIPHVFTQESIGGGFTSRCIFIVENNRGQIVPHPSPPDTALETKLLHDLEHIHMLSGPMHFTDKARELYEQWYVSECEKMDAGAPELRDPAFDGYNSRRATHIRKLSMVMSASRGGDMLITPADFKRAVKLLELAEKKMAGVFSRIGKARYVEETEILLAYIKTRGTVSKSEILTHFYRQIDDTALDTIARVLQGMHVVQVERDRSDVYYHYRPRSGSGAS